MLLYCLPWKYYAFQGQNLERVSPLICFLPSLPITINMIHLPLYTVGSIFMGKPCFPQIVINLFQKYYLNSNIQNILETSLFKITFPEEVLSVNIRSLLEKGIQTQNCII